jgi:hypothetical protein
MEKYKKICERNKANGKKGGRPSDIYTPKNPVGSIGLKDKPRKADNDSDKDNDSDSDKDNININISKDISLVKNKFSHDTFNYQISKEFIESRISKDCITVQSLIKDKGIDNLIQEWSDEIRKMIEIDKRTETEIAGVLRFTQDRKQWKNPNDYDFWDKNLRSINKFRKKNRD